MIRGKTFIYVIIGALAIGLGIWLSQAALHRATEPSLEISGFYFPEPRDIQDFSLIDQSGRPFTRKNFEDAWTFVYFGYTFCPDVCPMTLTELNLLEKQFAQQNLNGNTAYLLISVDPERDTPERLREYTAYFNEKFQGATGAIEELQKLARQLGVIFRRAPGQDNEENYAVDHSSTLLLIDPDGRLHAVFTPPHTPDTLFSDFKKIRARYRILN